MPVLTEVEVKKNRAIPDVPGSVHPDRVVTKFTSWEEAKKSFNEMLRWVHSDDPKNEIDINKVAPVSKDAILKSKKIPLSQADFTPYFSKLMLAFREDNVALLFSEDVAFHVYMRYTIGEAAENVSVAMLQTLIGLGLFAPKAVFGSSRITRTFFAKWASKVPRLFARGFFASKGTGTLILRGTSKVAMVLVILSLVVAAGAYALSAACSVNFEDVMFEYMRVLKDSKDRKLLSVEEYNEIYFWLRSKIKATEFFFIGG